MKTSNTSGKKHQSKDNTNKKKISRELQIGNLLFESSSQAAIFFLENSKISQSDIARICDISQPCVCQLASTLKPKKKVKA